MFRHILVVCTGNVCRSPLAAALLQRALPERHVSSAGLAAPVGREADATVRELASADGLDLTGHRARQLTPEMLRDAELVLVMSEGQRREVGRLDPGALGKTMLVGHWSEGEKDVPDPFRRSEAVHRDVQARLVRAVAEWQKRL